MGNGETLGRAALEHGPMLVLKSLELVAGERRPDASTRPDPPVPCLPCELQFDIEGFAVREGEATGLRPRRLDGGDALHAAAGPLRIVPQNDAPM